MLWSSMVASFACAHASPQERAAGLPQSTNSGGDGPSLFRLYAVSLPFLLTFRVFPEGAPFFSRDGSHRSLGPGFRLDGQTSREHSRLWKTVPVSDVGCQIGIL